MNLEARYCQKLWDTLVFAVTFDQLHIDMSVT